MQRALRCSRFLLQGSDGKNLHGDDPLSFARTDPLRAHATSMSATRIRSRPLRAGVPDANLIISSVLLRRLCQSARLYGASSDSWCRARTRR